MFIIWTVANYYWSKWSMNYQLVIKIPYLFVISLVYTIYIGTTIATVIATNNTSFEQQKHLVIGKDIVDKYIIKENIFQFDTIQELIQQQPDKESNNSEPITDLPIIDSPCKSSCPPNYKLCLYICE